MPGSIIASQIFGLVNAAGALTAAGMAVAFGINLVVSRIIASSASPEANTQKNLGSRQQVPPAGSNKLPVVYGSAYVGGVITDLTISNDNQTMYYCLSLAEVTNTQGGATGDIFTFGNVYWGGKRCVFDTTDQTRVVSLLDESTNESQTNVDGNMFIYLYRNGSYQPTNSATNAVTLMSDPNLAYVWDNTKLMSNCAFAIVKLVYNADAGLTGIQQTRFQVNNPRTAPGDCFSDFLQSTRYGAGVPSSQVDSTSLATLNSYCAGAFTYTPAAGGSATITRFKFDGVLDTSVSIMSNMQNMAASCDCLLRYNELTAKWGVIVQSPAYVVALPIDDSNMVSALQITPTDLSSTPNIIESKFANGSEKDTFASAVFSLSQVAPTLLYPNEPINKQSVTLPLVNSDVRAQYIAQRLLKAGREDLIVKVTISFAGLQLEAGDIVTLTSPNYGWTNKLFRISQVTENFSDDGQITASLTLIEYNSTVYDDTPITQFTPAPNTGIPSPLVFGTMYAPVVVNLNPTAANPSFGVSVTAASSGVSQYAEVWYSAFSAPSDPQRIFAGTTAVKSAGNPYTPGSSMGVVTLENIPQGNWYFFVRMVNSLGSSQYSAASSVLQWRPTTFQFTGRYIVVAYATSITGTGISDNPRGKTYFGLWNTDTTPAYSSDPSNYTWYFAQPTFGTNIFLAFSNRGGRKFSFATDFAAYAAGTAAFVPTSVSLYDPTIWSALPDGVNTIDLDVRTGQLITTGTTTTGIGEIAITNSTDGKIVAELATLLDFGPGISQKTSAVAQLTIDKYGRVLGFVSPDDFNYTLYEVIATAGQTVFTPTARSASYILGQCLVFRNGMLLDESEYTEILTTITLGTSCAAGTLVSIISMSAVASGITFVNTGLIVQTVGASSIVYTSTALPNQKMYAGDIITFANTGTPTQYTILTINYTTRTITFTTTLSGVLAGNAVYQYRASSSAYRPFSRWTDSLTNQSLFTPTEWSYRTGYEKLFFNGTAVNDLDYDLTTTLSFSQNVTGLVTSIQFAENILTTPAGASQTGTTNTSVGVTNYSFNFDLNAFELYINGTLVDQGTDYTISTGVYALSYTPTTNNTMLQQTTYQRTGAA
jgi:hypothetical protein